MILKFTSLNRTALFSPDRNSQKRSWYSSMMAVAVFLFFGSTVGFAQTAPTYTVCPGFPGLILPAGDGGLTLNNSNIPSLLGVTAVDPDGTETITYSASPSVITCADIGPGFSIAVTATDSDGTDICNITVDVFDGGPFASCNDITVNLDASGNYMLIGADNTALSMGSSACTGISSVTVAPNTFDCTDIGAPIQVTVTVEDGNTATAFCLANVTVEDNMAPVVTPAPQGNIAMNNAAGTCGATVNYTVPTFDDNCGGTGQAGTRTAGLASGSTFPVGTTTVTHSFTDAGMNTVTHSFDVVISDTETPVITCPGNVSANNDTGLCGAAAANVPIPAPTVTDNCTVTVTNDAPAVFPVGATTVTFTASDGTNSATCTMTVTITDNEAPTLTCPTLNASYPNDLGLCTTNVTVQVSPTDNCGFGSVINDFNAGGANATGDYPVGSTIVTFTATDVNSNTSTCSVTVTVIDTEAPTGVNDPGPLTANSGSVACQATVTWPAVTAMDNCMGSVTTAFTAIGPKMESISILTATQAGNLVDFGDFPVGETVVSYTVSDDATAANTITGSFTVTVSDNEAPAITCPATTTITFPSCSAANEMVPDYRGNALITDNCTGYSVVQDPPPGTLLSAVGGLTPSNGESFTVELTVTDAFTNNLSDVCTFTVNLSENDSPSPTTAGAILGTLDFECGGPITLPAPTALDGCGNLICGEPFPATVATNVGPPCTSGGPAGTETYNSTGAFGIPDNSPAGITNTITVSNPNLNIADVNISLESQHTWVGDLIISITSPDGTVVQLIDRPGAPLSNFGFGCDQDNLNLTFDEDLGTGMVENICEGSFTGPGVPGPPYAINTASTNFPGPFNANVTLDMFDGEDPNGVWTLTVSDNGNGDTGSILNWSLDIETQATAASVTNYEFQVGDHDVTWVFDDGAGNTTSQFQEINVSNDVTPPVLTCSDVTLELDENGEASISGNTILGEGLDLGTGSTGSNVAEYCITAASDLEFTFFWEYTQEPDFDELTFSIDGASTLLTDPNGPASQSGDQDISLLTGETFCITLDNDGSIFSDAQIAFLPGLVGDLAIGNWVATGLASYIEPNITDFCGVDFSSILINGSSVANFDCSDIGANTVTVTANDVSTLGGSCSPTVTIEDNLSPSNFTVMGGGTLPADTTVDCNAIPTNTTMLNAEDNCEGTLPTVFSETSTKSGNPASCADYNYAITRTWTAADNSSNTAAYTQLLTVIDTLAPSNPTYTATVANNGTINTNPGNNCFATITLILNGLTDCTPLANVTTTNNSTEGNGSTSASGDYDVGTHTIVFTTTDVCGNSSTHNYTFTVQDGIAPVASCVNSLNLGLPSSGILVLQPFAVDNNSFDNCTNQADLILSITPDTFTCVHVGMAVEVELTVEDEGGLTSSCTTTVTIQDNNDPTAVCQPINIALDANGMATIAAADVDGGSSDDCALAASPFAVTPSSFTEANIGSNVVTFTVTDAAGNTSTCTTTVSIDYPPTCFEFGGESIGNGVVPGGQGEIIEFPVHVTDFTNVNSFQFTMNIDVPDVGEFVDVSSTNAVLDPASGGSFFYSLVQTDSLINTIDTTFVPDQMGMDSIGSIDTTYTGLFDQLSVNWLNPTPQTIADEGIAFTVRILLTGDLGDNSPINPTTGINGNNPQISYSYNNVTSPALTPCFGAQGFIIIQNVVVAGEIYNEDGDPANTVNIELYNLPDIVTPGDMQTTMTDGIYSFDVNNSPGNYTVRPYKYTNWANGVTTADVSDIQRHAIGVANFDFGSSYKEIAADMDNDLFVTTFDALLLNQYVASAFTLPPPAGIPSWRFVPAAQQFNYSSFVTVEPYDTTLTFMNLTADTLANDFIAIKMGDVNGDSNPQSLTNESADPFGDNDVHFQIKDQSFQAGELVTVELSADQFNDLRAYQWILQFDQNVLNFADVQMGTLPALGIKNFGLNLLEEGKIVMTWFTTATESKSSDEVLYSFTFEAARAGQLSEILSIGQVEHFRSEAYGIASGDNRNIDLRFTDTDQELVANFALLQNSPNPFKDQTSIGFYLPEAATATLSLMDVSGRLLKAVEIEATKGYNEVTISKDELPAAGVVHYQLETPTHSAVKKMVILD